MIINYTLKKSQLRETTKGKGIIKYHLLDEQGKIRVVSAIVNFGFKNKIKSISPIHSREQPLLDVLFKAEINEKITVDFTEYNMKFPRDAAAARKIKAIKTDKVVDPYDDSVIKGFDSLQNHKLRFVKLFLVSALAVVAILFVLDGFFSD